MPDVVKLALRVAAARHNAYHGISFFPPITEPTINFKHVDGPYLASLNGTMHWLTWRERLMAWLGRWDAWDLEYRHSPVSGAQSQRTTQ